MLENRRCGCGATFSECSFWSDVGARAFGGFDTLDIGDVLDLKASVDEWERVGILALEAASGRRSPHTERYLDLLRSLYRAAAEVSGCDVIVDSSKDVSHGYVLQSLGEGSTSGCCTWCATAVPLPMRGRAGRSTTRDRAGRWTCAPPPARPPGGR